MKAPCEGYGSVSVRDYFHCEDFYASVLPPVCSCSGSTFPYILRCFHAWAASRCHQPGLNKYLDMSRQEMTVPGHPTVSGAEQAPNTPCVINSSDTRLSPTPSPMAARPGNEARSQGGPCRTRDPSKALARLSARWVTSPRCDPTSVPTAGSHDDISEVCWSVH